MTSELRKELERQYNLAAAAAPQPEAAVRRETKSAEAEAEDADCLTAPRSYKKEYAEIFKTLPPAMRKYLRARESETEKGFSRLNNELNSRRWIDEAYAARAERLERTGINKARDWVETMARIDDALEADPLGTLNNLASVYGVTFIKRSDSPEKSPASAADLSARLNELENRFSRFADDCQAKIRDAEQITAAQKAREASFAPKGKTPARDLSDLTTREILELKLAEYD